MPNPMRQKAVEGLKVSDSFTYSCTFKKEVTEQFGYITRDYNPVHYDLRCAESKVFDRLICHGLFNRIKLQTLVWKCSGCPKGSSLLVAKDTPGSRWGSITMFYRDQPY